jgi:putative flavoprotein involved in K+ transport
MDQARGISGEIESTDTIVIGAGQAGIAASEHLGRQGIAHLVLERSRIAERWRSERWDSLVANGPAWHDRFPNMRFEDLAPDAFAPKDRVAQYFEDYARMVQAPVRTGVEVLRVQRNTGRMGFRVETSQGIYQALRVVVATGPFQRPSIPSISDAELPVAQLHSSQYRNPAQLPNGAVLVVGAGSSGVQIAEELCLAGRSVYLSVGPHERPPRAYRGKDCSWWLGVLGEWDKEIAPSNGNHVTIAISGAHGGRTVDFRALAQRGVTLVGSTRVFSEGAFLFQPDLAHNLQQGDQSHLSLLQAADAFAAANGLDLPLEPEAHRILPDPPCVTQPLRQLRLQEAGIGSVVWATGFASDYGWLQVDAFDANGRPRHHRGISSERGVYFLGLPGLSRRGSAFIWGVWHDAKHIADHIATQRAYFAEAERAAQPQRT